MHDIAQHGTAVRGSAGSPERIAYRVRDAAAQIGVSTRQLYRLIELGEIESFQVGGCRRVTHAELEAYVAKRIDAAKAQQNAA